FVGNEDIVSWFASPIGFIYLFLIVLIALTGIVIRYAGLFQIVRDDLIGERISIATTVRKILLRAHLLVKICSITITVFLLAIIPLAAGLGLVYLIWLAEFDINYYLYTTPPEWYRALIFGGIWAFLWAVTSISLAAMLLPALPAYLEGNKSFIEAIKEIWRHPTSNTLRFLKVIGIAAAIWISARIVTEAVLVSLFLFLTTWAYGFFESLRPVAFIAGGYLFTRISAGIVISFFGFSLISAIITKFYFGFTRPGLMSEIPGFKKLTIKTIRLLTWWAKPVRAALLLLIIISGSFVTTLLITGESGRDNGVWIITHRANALGAPENSLPALENSIILGADVVEIDVQLTADGTVVILHDEDLMRVAGDPRRIAGISDEELSDIRLLSGEEYSDAELQVPTLTEYLERAKNRVIVMIELKYYGFRPELAEKTIDIIREHGMEDQVQVKSLSYRAVEQVRQLAPELQTGYVSAAALGDISRLPVQFLSVNQANINSDLMARAALQQMDVYAWTVNTRESIVDVILKGVDGVITDRPEIAIEVIGEIDELTATERLLLQLGLIVLATTQE
ncbi:MAG: hypothetical protein EA391_11290, partial [Balneolaceae bacterium]